MNDLVPNNSAMPIADFREMMEMGEVFSKSCYFADAKSAAQAVVKIMAGREMGFGPVASMTGVHIIEGKPSLGSNLMAAAIRRSGRYDFEIVEHSDQVCAIRFKRKIDGAWTDLEPVERITLQDATAKKWTVNKDGTAKGPWTKTPKNMLFARCLSNGYKFHCPDLIGGVVVYDADELDPEPKRVEPASVETLTPTALQPLAKNGTSLPTTLPVSDPNAQSPSPILENGRLTEQEYQQIVAEIQKYRRDTNYVSLLCTIANTHGLHNLAKSRMNWFLQAIREGLVETPVKDQIVAIATSLKIPTEAQVSRLKELYGVESYGHLLKSEAAVILARLQDKLRQPAA